MAYCLYHTFNDSFKKKLEIPEEVKNIRHSTNHKNVEKDGMLELKDNQAISTNSEISHITLDTDSSEKTT